jgi:LCP family protein required for cell wall assembly
MKKLSSILPLAIIAALLLGAMYTLRWMQTPLDAPLELALPTQPQAPAQALVAQAQTATPRAQGNQKTCGESGTMALLVSGLAVPENRPVHGVGAVRLVKVDFDHQSAAVLNLPRALVITDTNMTEPRPVALTVAYRLARDAAKGENPQEINRKATQDMAQALVDNFGYAPDHYITVDPAKFVALVETLEGIDVDLKNPVDGTPDGLGSFPAGAQHLDGARTLELFRIFHPVSATDQGVWKKFERQRMVTLALLSAMLDSSNWDQFPQVAKDARQMVVTDLSASQVLDLLCMVKQVGEANTGFQVVPATMVKVVSDEEIRIQDAAALKDLIQQYTRDKK